LVDFLQLFLQAVFTSFVDFILIKEKEFLIRVVTQRVV